MPHEQPAAFGVLAGLAVVGLVLAPFALADAGAIAVYYGGLVGPPLAGLFAAVAAIGFAAAVRGRSDPATVAGVVLVLGVLTLGLLVAWAASVSPALVGGMTTVSALQYHRWALVTAAVAMLTAGGWFSRGVL